MKAKKIIASFVISLPLALSVCFAAFFASAIGYRPKEPVPAEEAGEEMPRESSPRTVLLLGLDAVSESTDVMMLFSFDEGTKSASLLRLPRDTYAELGTEKEGERRAVKLNSLYARARAAGKTPEVSARAVCTFLSKNLGIAVNDYVLTDLEGFRKTVDLLGGIPVTLQSDMDYDDDAQDLHIHLRAGTQTLNGEQAEGYVRFRSGYARGDLGRLEAQEPFLSGAFSAAKKAFSSPASLFSLLPVVMKNVKTSLSLPAAVSLARSFLKIGKESLSFPILPGAAVREAAGGAWYYVMNRDAAKKMLSDLSLREETAEFDPKGIFGGGASLEIRSVYDADRKQYEPNDP